MAPRSVVGTVANPCKRRGLVYPCDKIYGDTRSTWGYDPLGMELKESIKHQRWKTSVTGCEDVTSLDSSIILPRQVWEVPGYTATFTGPLVESLHIHKRYHVDHLLETYETKHDHPLANGLADVPDSETGQLSKWTKPQMFSGLIRIYLGPVDNKQGLRYMHPEIAQGIFVNFKNVMTTARAKPSFSIGQIDKTFRSEIAPGNFTSHTREFGQMKIEYLAAPDRTEGKFDEWVDACWSWFIDLGVNPENMRQLGVLEDERAHYFARTINFECRFHFQDNKWGEPVDVASRTDYDLGCHIEHSKENLRYHDQVTGEKYVPYIIKSSFGLTRALITFLCDAYTEEEVPNAEDGTDARIMLEFDPRLSPAKVAVLPLSEEGTLAPTTEAVADKLHQYWAVDRDTSGTIGHRCRR